jgi:hypothetical protein
MLLHQMPSIMVRQLFRIRRACTRTVAATVSQQPYVGLHPSGVLEECLQGVSK